MRIDQIGFRWLAAIIATSCFWVAAQTPTASPKSGLAFQVKGSGAEAAPVLVTNVALYVKPGDPVSPFLPSGPFEASWEGLIAVDLRSEYFFQATLRGNLKVEVNGATVLEAKGDGGFSAVSPAVRLNKGTNAFKVTFQSPAEGASVVRLFWSQRPPLFDPIPNEALTSHAQSPLAAGAALAHGRGLFLEHRCAKCHTPGPVSAGAVELGMDAPSFAGIGARRQPAWMARWIADPKSMRPSAEMPRVFHGEKAAEHSRVVAAYLASLAGEPLPKLDAPSADKAAVGKKLFETLNCAACHHPLEGEKADAQKISLTQVKQKFSGTSALVEFLKKPDTHYRWIRMPNFKLSQDEAVALASYLESSPTQLAALDEKIPTDAATIEAGKKLVQSSGCLNCHGDHKESTLQARPLKDLAAEQWKSGCLAPQPSAKAPHYSFSDSDREALLAFARSDRQSLARHVSAEFAQRQVSQLNCAQCHGQVEGFPKMDILGGKLRPEWMKTFIAGELPYKPRPWLEQRMPGFGVRAGELAAGLTTSHGLPPQTPPDRAANKEMAEIGKKLVSSDGGFSCVSCHAVGKYGATQVFESAGINLIYSAERLQHDYYVRWIRNPLAIDPQTKMPVYFDEEANSPLTDVLEGSGPKQIEAIWDYLLLGPKMPPPGEVTE